MKIRKTTFLFIQIVTMIFLVNMSLIPTTLAIDTNNTYLSDKSKYLPNEIITALEKGTNAINTDVKLPTSMNIQIANINMDKVIITTPLNAFSYDFKGELRKHGYSEGEIAKFTTYEDYTNVENDWKLAKEQITIAKKLYPELKDTDISNWTNGDFKKYYTYVDKTDLEKRFTQEQLQQLIQKGIKSEDLFYLFKEFQNADTIMAPSLITWRA